MNLKNVTEEHFVFSYQICKIYPILLKMKNLLFVKN